MESEEAFVENGIQLAIKRDIYVEQYSKTVEYRNDWFVIWAEISWEWKEKAAWSELQLAFKRAAIDMEWDYKKFHWESNQLISEYEKEWLTSCLNYNNLEIIENSGMGWDATSLQDVDS